jgi:hypothetical protein
MPAAKEAIMAERMNNIEILRQLICVLSHEKPLNTHQLAILTTLYGHSFMSAVGLSTTLRLSEQNVIDELWILISMKLVRYFYDQPMNSAIDLQVCITTAGNSYLGVLNELAIERPACRSG